MRPVFPFSAIVGQDTVKLALMIAAIEPTIGGVLIFGDRGTGKSTAIRGLAALLPEMSVVSGCPYNCAPDAPGGHCDACRPGMPRIEAGDENDRDVGCLGHVPAFLREARIRVAAEWKQGDLRAALRLVESGALSLDGLITHQQSAAEAVSAYGAAFEDPDCLKMILDWSNPQ